MTVPLVRHSGPFFEWTNEELKQMDQKIKKSITALKALFPNSDIDSLYTSGKEGEKSVAISEYCVIAIIQ